MIEIFAYKLVMFSQGILHDSAPFFPKAGQSTIENIFNYVYGVLGVIAVLMVVYGSIQMIISQGNSEKVATARRTVIYSLVGLVVIIISGSLISYVVSRLA